MNKIFHCFVLGLVLQILGCQGDSKEDEQRTVEKKEVSTKVIRNPNVPVDMGTIRRETRNYRSMKDAVKKEKKADRALMEKERRSSSRETE